MGSQTKQQQWRQPLDFYLNTKVMAAALVRQEEDEEEDEEESRTDDNSNSSISSISSRAEPAALPTFDVPYFRYIDEEDEGRVEDEHEEGKEEEEDSCSRSSSCSSHSRSLSSLEDDDCPGDSSVSCRRYGSAWSAAAAAPHRALGHLLDHMRLDDHPSSTSSRDSEIVLQDFLLTYMLFMSTKDLCQALLRNYSSKRGVVCEETAGALLRKRKVLHIVSRWASLYKDFLRRDNDFITLFMKSLHRCVLDDLCNCPSLETELRTLQSFLSIQHCTVDTCSPPQKSKSLHKQLSIEDNWPQCKTSPQADREVLYCIYVCEDSYVSVKAKSSARAEALLSVLADRLDIPQEDIVIAAVSRSGEKLLLQPQDRVFPNCVFSVERLQVYRRDLTTVLTLVSDSALQQQRTAHLLSLNAWDVAVTLTNFDWSLFECVQEPELICFTCSRDTCVGHTGALERMLQRCSEVQLWVMTELLLCSALCKRVQLLKKFIKVAAHCKAQRNMSSFFAIIMGLNTAAVSRLSQTWEKVSWKFRKVFSELESLTDPSFNHKTYRTTFSQMKSPKIPFLPLLLKDITFVREGNKTFLDNLLNFDKLHMMAESARLIKHCKLDPMGDGGRQKDDPDMSCCIRHLHIISSQETLFDLSHRLEPRT